MKKAAPKVDVETEVLETATLAGEDLLAELDSLEDFDFDTPFAEAEPEKKKPEPKAKSKPVEEKPATKIVTVDTGTKGAKPYSDIEELITDITDIPEYLTVVGYGRTGTGKTTFGASADNTLLLEVEPEGTFSVATSKGERYKAKKFPVNTWGDFEKIYFYLKANVHKYDVLAIDTLTRLLELCVKNIVLGETRAEDTELMDKDVFKVSLPQRGDIAQKMIFWLDAIRKLPIHKVWLCQEANNTNDDSITHDIYPDLQRKIRNYVLADATIVGRFDVVMKETLTEKGTIKTPQFRFIVKPDDTVYTKDRTNALGNGLANPTMTKLLSLVYKKKEV